MSFSEWEEVKLEECSELIFSGGTPSTSNSDYWNGDINWLSSGETRNTFITGTEKLISQSGVNNSSTKLAKKYDVVIASAGQGNTRGQTSICMIDTYINQSIIAIRADKEKLDPHYLFYNIYGRYFELRKISDGHSIRGSLTTKMIRDLKIALPQIKEQQMIGNILLTLDNKIETNNRINKTLEEMAQAIFKHWFVDFEFPNEDGEPYKSSGGEMVDSELGPIPKGWEVKSIYSLADFIYGAPFSSKLFNERAEGLPLIRIRDLKTGNPQFYTNEQHRNSTIVEPGDILIGMDAEFKPTVWKGKRAVLNQRVCLLRPRNSNIHRYYLYELVKPHMRSLEFSKTGTTVIHFGKSDVDSIMIVHPSFNLLKAFNNLITPIHGKLVNISIENRTLASIRDTLLPKLMSGEIRVPIDNK